MNSGNDCISILKKSIKEFKLYTFNNFHYSLKKLIIMNYSEKAKFEFILKS